VLFDCVLDHVRVVAIMLYKRGEFAEATRTLQKAVDRSRSLRVARRNKPSVSLCAEPDRDGGLAIVRKQGARVQG
jgi:hypothetical protein